MTRLIDADAVKAVFEEKSSEAVCGAELCKAIISRIDEAPIIAAVPVVHGEWISGVKCSKCGYRTYEWLTSEFHYCPNCGAKMDL